MVGKSAPKSFWVTGLEPGLDTKGTGHWDLGKNTRSGRRGHQIQPGSQGSVEGRERQGE